MPKGYRPVARAVNAPLLDFDESDAAQVTAHPYAQTILVRGAVYGRSYCIMIRRLRADSLLSYRKFQKGLKLLLDLGYAKMVKLRSDTNVVDGTALVVAANRQLKDQPDTWCSSKAVGREEK